MTSLLQRLSNWVPFSVGQRTRLCEAAQAFARSKTLVILTGAGVSVASGIPPFRGKGGIWGKAELVKYAFAGTLAADPEGAWNHFERARLLVQASKPNPAHDAIACMLKMKPQAKLFTQNVDGLHGDGAYELHGRLSRFRCTGSCGSCYDAACSATASKVQRCCLKCGAALRHDVVLFGEDVQHVDQLLVTLAAADLVLFVGTSGLVTDTKGVAEIMREKGVVTIEVNTARSTASSNVVSFYIRGSAEKILPQMFSGGS